MFEVMDGLTVYRYPYFYPHRFQRLVYGGGIWPNFKRSLLAKIQAPFLLISGIYHTMKIARKEEVDVIHSHWTLPNGLMGAICSHIQGRKHVITSHGADIVILEKLPFRHLLARYIFNHTESVTAVSKQIQRRIQNIIPDSNDPDYIRVLPMGVDLNIFAPQTFEKLPEKQITKSKYTLLAIGRLVDKKGFTYLIKAFPAILEKYPWTELIICGDGPLRSNLENLAKSLGIAQKVIFKGYVSNSEKVEYLLKSDILILPSIITDSGDTEGLPVVLIEGMATGVTIVATDVGGIGEVVIDGLNGLLVPARNSNAISEKVLELLISPQLMSAISKNAKESVKKYGWDTVGNQYRLVMEESLL